MKPKADTQDYDLTLVGYARVSTEDQSLDVQIEAFKRHRIHPDNIFAEKISGAALRRPQRELAIKKLRPGMTLVVTKLDRLSRSVIDMLMLLERLNKMGAEFKSIDDAFDTRTPFGRAHFMMAGTFAQLERDLIRQRTQEGVNLAKARGVKFGAKLRFTSTVVGKAEAMLRQGKSVRCVARSLGFAPATVRLHIKRDQIQKLRAEGPKRET